MHHSVLPLIKSCTRSWNFAWHLLWRSTTESKNIVNFLAISQTIYTLCCEDEYFPKGKFELYNSLFHSVYLVFPKNLFSIANLFAVRYLWDACNEDKCCVAGHKELGRWNAHARSLVQQWCRVVGLLVTLTSLFFNGLIAATDHFYFICAEFCISCLQYTFEFVCCTCFMLYL